MSFGSSPLARGTPYCENHARVIHRFIPAGAGNTVRQLRRQLSLAVHPRWRGEHRESWLSRITGHGSSPLARGTHPAALLCLPKRRFIPAGAGNTA